MFFRIAKITIIIVFTGKNFFLTKLSLKNEKKTVKNETKANVYTYIALEIMEKIINFFLLITFLLVFFILLVFNLLIHFLIKSQHRIFWRTT